MRMRSVLASCLGVALLAGPAFAGPVMKFGPEDKGLLKLEYKGQLQLTVRDTGAEADGKGTTEEFNFRRNRLALMGAYGDKIGLYVQSEFGEDQNIGPLGVSDGDNSDFQLIDAVMRFKLHKNVNVWAGKFKYNLTRENLEACEGPLTMDRSLLIRAPFVTTRDKGVAVWGDLAEGMFQYKLDVMNGRNDSVSSPESNFRYSARAHVSLLDPETGYGYQGTYLGKKKVLTVGAAYQMEDAVAYANSVAQTGAVDYQAWTADLFFEYPVEQMGTVTFSAAYVDYDLDSAYQGAAPEAGTIGLNGEKNGYYLKAGYLLPNLPLQLFVRAESWSFANLGGVVNQDVDWFGGGVNYYFNDQNLKLTLELSNTDFDKELVNEDFTTLVTQLQLVF